MLTLTHKCSFFKLGDRAYINNAIPIATVLDVITREFGVAYNFKIKFRRPFTTQGILYISPNKMLEDFAIEGSFIDQDRPYYFGFAPSDEPLLEEQPANDTFDICWTITDHCRGIVEECYEKNVGPMKPNDKVVFAIFEVPDTSVLFLFDRPEIKTLASHIGGDRIKVDVFLNDVYLGSRYSSVREFKL